MSSEAIYLIYLRYFDKLIQLLKTLVVCVNKITLSLKGIDIFSGGTCDSTLDLLVSTCDSTWELFVLTCDSTLDLPVFDFGRIGLDL